MAVHAKDLINIIVSPTSDIITIIIDYGKLKQKLQNPESHTWYFNQGLESHQAKLSDLKKKFESFRSDFNDFDLDELISKLNEVKTEKSEIPRRMGLIQQIHLASVLSRMKYLESLIEMKSRISEMMPIDYYIENGDALLTITGWEAEK
ncbi:MAG TPA: hypothetical protein VFC92_05305 [Bacteroidales bacterium]|nr:hypothetical protein [Bacteroidales bacterium]